MLIKIIILLTNIICVPGHGSGSDMEPRSWSSVLTFLPQKHRATISAVSPKLRLQEMNNTISQLDNLTAFDRYIRIHGLSGQTDHMEICTDPKSKAKDAEPFIQKMLVGLCKNMLKKHKSTRDTEIIFTMRTDANIQQNTADNPDDTRQRAHTHFFNKYPITIQAAAIFNNFQECYMSRFAEEETNSHLEQFLNANPSFSRYLYLLPAILQRECNQQSAVTEQSQSISKSQLVSFNDYYADSLIHQLADKLVKKRRVIKPGDGEAALSMMNRFNYDYDRDDILKITLRNIQHNPHIVEECQRRIENMEPISLWYEDARYYTGMCIYVLYANIADMFNYDYAQSEVCREVCEMLEKKTLTINQDIPVVLEFLEDTVTSCLNVEEIMNGKLFLQAKHLIIRGSFESFTETSKTGLAQSIFRDFKSLKCLDLSHCPNLTTLPSNMFCGVQLNVLLFTQDAPIEILPHRCFQNAAIEFINISALTNLRILSEACFAVFRTNRYDANILDFSHSKLQEIQKECFFAANCYILDLSRLQTLIVAPDAFTNIWLHRPLRLHSCMQDEPETFRRNCKNQMCSILGYSSAAKKRNDPNANSMNIVTNIENEYFDYRDYSKLIEYSIAQYMSSRDMR